MSKKKIDSLEQPIEALKGELMAMGPMKAGNSNKTIQRPRQADWRLPSIELHTRYTHKMKSRTEYVRAEHVSRLSAEVEQYKRWWQLMALSGFRNVN